MIEGEGTCCFLCPIWASVCGSCGRGSCTCPALDGVRRRHIDALNVSYKKMYPVYTSCAEARIIHSGSRPTFLDFERKAAAIEAAYLSHSFEFLPSSRP